MSEEHQEEAERPDGPDAEQQQAETKARELGWVPKSEWRGDPEIWSDAATWMEKGDKLLGSQLRKAEGRLAEITSAQERSEKEFAGRLERMERMHDAALERQRDQLESEFEEKIRKAAGMGDTDAVEAALKARKDSAKRLADAENEEAETEDKADLSRDQSEWLTDNKAWYGKDKLMTRWANTFAEDLEEEMPAASEKDKLGEISNRMRERFPEKFGRKQTRSRVEGGNRVFDNGNGDARGKMFAKLPPEAKEQFNRDVAKKLYKVEDRESWAETYFS